MRLGKVRGQGLAWCALLFSPSPSSMLSPVISATARRLTTALVGAACRSPTRASPTLARSPNLLQLLLVPHMRAGPLSVPSHTRAFGSLPANLHLPPTMSRNDGGRVFSGKSTVPTAVATSDPTVAPAHERKKIKQTLNWQSSSNSNSLPTVVRPSAPASASSADHASSVAYACCTAESYNLDKLVVILHNHHYMLSAFAAGDDVDNQKVLHVHFLDSHREKTGGEMFVFKEGTFVTWGASTEQVNAVRTLLKQVEINPYSNDPEDYEYEAIPYKLADATGVREGIFTFKADTDPYTQKLEKYVMSDAMALSVKLGAWESLLDEYVTDIEHIPKALMEGMKPPITPKDAWKNTGALLYLRYNINLFGYLLSPPDFYWDRPAFENLYKKVLRMLDVSSRTQVMNSKLNHWEQLAGILRDHIRDSASTRLELIIIFLIALEVFFQLLKYVIKLYHAIFSEEPSLQAQPQPRVKAN